MKPYASAQPLRSREMSLTADLVFSCARLESDPGPDPSKRPLTSSDYRKAAIELDTEFPSEALWVFAYGSLIWKNSFAATESRRATAFGWHRSFCMTRTRWRGSPAQPGLMMALERGGRCDGVAYRMPEGSRIEQIENLLRREIEYEDAVPFMRWIHVTDGVDRWRALGSWVGPVGSEVQAKLSLAAVSKILARACGHVGSGADYLFQTVRHLEMLGIRDRNLWDLQRLVAQEIRMSNGDPHLPSSEAIQAADLCNFADALES